MNNPFNYTNELDPGEDTLVGREAEMRDLRVALDNNVPSLLLSRRNIGKSSLFRFFCFEARKLGYYVLQVECSFTTSIDLLHKELIYKLKEEGLWHEIQGHLKRLEPPSLEKSRNTGLEKIFKHSNSTTKKIPNYEATQTQIDQFINVLRALNLTIIDKRQPLLFLFDEVQTWSRIAQTEGTSIANIINAVFKDNTWVNYFFSGSQRRLIEEMFLDDEESGFWNAINTVELEVPAKEDLSKFIEEAFQQTGKTIDLKAIDTLLAASSLSTEAVQELAFFTWEATENGSVATSATVSDALQIVLKKHNPGYRRIVSKINTQGKSRDEVFLGLAKIPTKKISAVTWIREVGLSSRITKMEMKKAIESLLNTGEIVQLEDGTYTPSDPFLTLWVQQMSQSA